jgi:cytochrome c oxidase subunit 4
MAQHVDPAVVPSEVEETLEATQAEAIVHEPELAVHPGPKQYVVIAIVLALATAIEVGIYYIPGLPRGLLIGSLLTLAVLKFTLVVLWFMHLRFDSRIFRRLFVTGMILAISVYMIVLVTFGAMEAPVLLFLVGAFVAIGAIWFVLRTRQTRLRRQASFLQPGTEP